MSFTFATFNANSIRARLQIILDWLHREQPDILCIQETKVQDKDFPAKPFEEAGYHVVYKGQKSYNGVAIISKHHLDNIQTDLYDGRDEEARFVSAIILDIPVVNVYVPQGFAVGTEKFEYKLSWFKDLLTHIKTNCDPGQPLILTGDFNVALESIDVYDPEKYRGQVCFHPDEQAIMREFLDWGLMDIFRKHQPDGGHYTFWDYRVPNALKRKIGWRIDYILATPSLAEKSRNAWIDTEARALEKPSDHTFLVAEFDLHA
jgi:exodeoxyribonuclease-3